jgi:Protein of unknown function (DUF2934)
MLQFSTSWDTRDTCEVLRLCPDSTSSVFSGSIRRLPRPWLVRNSTARISWIRWRVWLFDGLRNARLDGTVLRVTLMSHTSSTKHRRVDAGAVSDSTLDRQRERDGAALPAQPSPTESRMARIARRAHEIYEARGGEYGKALEDWLQAEREIDAEIENESA